jgi:hypothetical protein
LHHWQGDGLLQFYWFTISFGSGAAGGACPGGLSSCH